MFLTVHASIGVLIGERVSAPLWAFVLGFLAHFLLDLIPHGDQDLTEGYSFEDQVKRMTAATSIDAFILSSFILTLYSKNILSQPQIVGWAVFGSLLPDFIVGLWGLSRRRLFNRYARFHKQIHYLSRVFHLPLAYGVILQILFWLFLGIKIY